VANRNKCFLLGVCRKRKELSSTNGITPKKSFKICPGIAEVMYGPKTITHVPKRLTNLFLQTKLRKNRSIIAVKEIPRNAVIL
jgi:hypothetical protein